jgi:hypothetical protein
MDKVSTSPSRMRVRSLLLCSSARHLRILANSHSIAATTGSYNRPYRTVFILLYCTIFIWHFIQRLCPSHPLGTVLYNP